MNQQELATHLDLANHHANATPSLGGSPIDKVLVIKSERKLHLVSAGQTLKSYRVSLGKQRTTSSLENFIDAGHTFLSHSSVYQLPRFILSNNINCLFNKIH